VITLVAFLVCSVAYWFFDSWAKSPSPTDIIREQTDRIVQAAAFHAGSPTPSTLTGEVTFCAGFLPAAMKRNNNNYTIVVVNVMGGMASPKPFGTGAVQANVNVVFRDGTRIEMEYYQYMLVICREEPDRSAYF
jgi:hypothetical protein